MPNPERLAEALFERGFSPTYAVRLTKVGPRKRMVIKVIRELTHWGQAQARDATIDLPTIVEHDDREAAEVAATRLREVAASVEIAISELRLYAYDPDDPRRGDQPIERLRIVELELAHDHGQLGAWTEGSCVEYGDAAGLLAAIDELRAGWSARGKLEATHELEILERLSARELDMEERLRASVGEARIREATVYGDWLQAAGDPRGTIAAVALACSADDPDLAKIIAEHTRHLLGPSESLFEGERWEWTGPVLDSLILGDFPSTVTSVELEAALRLPICACLARLTLEHGLADEARLGEVLSAAACAPGLRELRLPRVREFALTGDRFARLETLVVEDGRVRVGPARLPELRSLEVGLNPPLASLLECFPELDAPKLEHFCLRLSPYDFWDQNFGSAQAGLVELLREPAFARLRTLTFALQTESLAAYPGFAKLLARVPAIATLERIDLREVVMTAECRREFEDHRDRLPGLLLPE